MWRFNCRISLRVRRHFTSFWSVEFNSLNNNCRCSGVAEVVGKFNTNVQLKNWTRWRKKSAAMVADYGINKSYVSGRAPSIDPQSIDEYTIIQ
jgi:hypothetical protein